jgi:hypothetical protein
MNKGKLVQVSPAMHFSDYEAFVASVVSDLKLSPGIKIFQQREFIGRRSNRKIAVDVSFELDYGGFTVLFLVECKLYTKKVEVGDIEEFRTKIDDIGAHKGLVFSTVGFQSGAVQTAKAYGIGLARLSDTPSPGDLLVIANGPISRPPIKRTAGVMLSGAINLGPWVSDGWQWFWSGPRLISLLFTLDHAFPSQKTA